MIAKKIYESVHAAAVEITWSEFKELPYDLSKYTLAYVGKHKAIKPNDRSANIDVAVDLDPVLLLELRLFNEEEEIFVFSDGVRLRQRHSMNGDEKSYKYIEKCIQLRDKSSIICHHYIDEENGGYDFLRYVKVM